jgi:hypothetical protein
LLSTSGSCCVSRGRFSAFLRRSRTFTYADKAAHNAAPAAAATIRNHEIIRTTIQDIRSRTGTQRTRLKASLTYLCDISRSISSTVCGRDSVRRISFPLLST